MEIQKTSNSQSNLEKEEWNWRKQPDWLQTLLQSHSHQDSMLLAQRQKYRSMEQNKKPRYKSTNLWTTYLRQRSQGYTIMGPFLLKPWRGRSLSLFEPTFMKKGAAPHWWPLRNWFDYKVCTHTAAQLHVKIDKGLWHMKILHLEF